MFHRNLLGVPDPPPLFPATLATETGTTCADPLSGSWLGRMAEQSLLTGYEPEDLSEISSEHTPINFPSRKSSFSPDIDDVPTIVAASDTTETIEAGQLTSPLFTQERGIVCSEVCHRLNMNKRKTFTNTLKNEAERSLQGECTGQKRPSEAEVEMDRKSWEKRNSDIALYETNQQLESQSLELHQVNQWADQARGANSR